MRNRLFLFIALVLTSLLSMGQNLSRSSKEPFWTKGCFMDLDNSYIEVVKASGYNHEEARQNALNEIIKRRSLATGSQATVSVNGSDVSVKSGHELIVKARVLDEYAASGANGYTDYILVQTAKNPTYAYENIEMTDKYGFSARAFVPGMAQIYKGSVAKGTCIIAAEILAVTGIIVCENMRSSYNKKAAEQPKFAKQYSAKAKNWKDAGNIAIGAAACIYAYNVIDAAVAKGKMRIKVGRQNGSALSILPYASPYSSGIYLGFNF